MADLATKARIDRLRAEAILVARRFGPVRFDQTDASWFLVDQFPVAPGWNQRQVAILIDIPYGTPGYPQVPLDWFWTDRELQTADGRKINHFFAEDSLHTDHEHYQKGWGHFCIHVRSWRPSPMQSLAHGDSILTYLELVHMVFRDKKTLAP